MSEATTVTAIIHRHITSLDGLIEEYQESIRESYAEGQTNVDAKRLTILRYKERKFALQTLLDEIEEQQA